MDGCKNTRSLFAKACHPQFAVFTANVWSEASFEAMGSGLGFAAVEAGLISNLNHQRPFLVHCPASFELRSWEVGWLYEVFQN